MPTTAASNLPSSKEKGYTPVEDLQDIHNHLTKTFYSGKTKDVKWRKDQLKSLAYMIQDNSEALTGKGSCLFSLLTFLNIYVPLGYRKCGDMMLET